jgi:hypothetical protein
MSDYRIDAATKEEWAIRALNAEAKLAKAVGALREILTRWDTPAWKDVEATGYVINRARATLDELEK